MPEDTVTNEELADLMETVEKLGNFSNQYGFMTLFSVIILLLILIGVLIFMIRSSRKNKQELEISSKERNHAMEHTDKIYDLVYNVQNRQVADLELIAESLKNSGARVEATHMSVNGIERDVSDIKKMVNTVDDRTHTIADTLNDIMDRVRLSDQCNRDILSKVTLIEKLVYADHNIVLSDEMPSDSSVMNY